MSAHELFFAHKNYSFCPFPLYFGGAVNRYALN